MKETIFGISLDEIHRRCNVSTIKDYSDYPLCSSFESLESCLEGSKKILTDKALIAMLRELYMKN